MVAVGLDRIQRYDAMSLARVLRLRNSRMDHGYCESGREIKGIMDALETEDIVHTIGDLHRT